MSLPSPTCVLDPPIADGSPVSVAAQFFEVGLAGSTKGACFQEPGYSYEPSSHGGRHNVSTRTAELALPEDAQPGEFCCASCWAAKGCEAWTVANGICTLLVPSALAVLGYDRWTFSTPKVVRSRRGSRPRGGRPSRSYEDREAHYASDESMKSQHEEESKALPPPDFTDEADASTGVLETVDSPPDKTPLEASQSEPFSPLDSDVERPCADAQT
ncbi:hypothetical protein DIPPA_23107, partial [Diplonema papillatum]